MQSKETKLTSQGQVSVPAAVRSFLDLVPGSVLTWTQDGDRIVVDRAKRSSTDDVHRALFGGEASTPRSLDDLKQGIRRHVQRRHARR